MEEESQFPTPGDYQLSEEEEDEEEETEETDDDDDDEYDSSKAFGFEAQLDEFRMKWQQELLGNQDAAESSEVAVPCSSSSSSSSSGNNNNGVQAITGHLSNEDQLDAIKNKAKWFYLEGIKAEQNGNLYNAVTYYRQAVQLVPDIEYHVNYNPGVKCRERQVSETSIGSNASNEDVEEGNLLALLSRLQASENVICSPTSEQRATHISSLPVEVVMYVFKWVVSTDLDTRSLEQLSQVCRGFYVCTRDEELWKLVCTRMFNGVNCKNCKKYGSWRQMFYQRPHLRYNGCYISKCSYIRQGEKGLDYFYKPWNLVEYFRFVRFFLNGDIVMMSSPEKPSVCITKLNTKFKSASMLCGYYSISGSTITAYLTRTKTNEYCNQYSRRNKRNRPNENDDPEHTFHVKFGLQSAGRRKFAKLIWRHYSLHTFYRSSNRETVTNFDLNEQNYPPLYFSRVKSYTTYAVKPLQ